MRYVPRPLQRLVAPLIWQSHDSEMEAEMTFHIDKMTDELVQGGMNADAARAAARRRFGNLRRLKERGHDEIAAPWSEALVRDVRHMARGLRRSPGFAAIVILTLGLAIGSNTAIFSIVDQILLRPLPYPRGENVVRVYETLPNIGNNVSSPANWLDWQRESKALEALAGWRPMPLTLTGDGEPVRLNGQLVTGEFFPLLRVAPLIGRTVTMADDQPNAPIVGVLSYKLWQRRFGGDPSVIGRMLQVNDRPAQIVGVMPPGFQFVQPDVDIWGAWRIDRTIRYRETSGRFMNVVARLRDGSSLGAARAEMTGIAQRLAAAYPFNRGSSVALIPLREDLTGQVQASLLMLWGAVTLVLAIACFNVANLLLARGAARRHEIAIRSSIGAGRAAIVRQLLVESLLLATCGGLLGILIARGTLTAVTAFVPAELLRGAELSVDWRVMGYALVLSLLTGLVVGLLPAFLASRQSAADAMRATAPTLTRGSQIRQLFVVGQVALTMLLLSGAGLLVRTLVSLGQAQIGLDQHGVLTMEIQLPTARYSGEPTRRFYQEAIAALRALPGVQSVAAANSLAVIGDPRGGTIFQRGDRPPIPLIDGQPMLDGQPIATIRVVTPGYFSTMRIPILRGREFTDADFASPAPGFIVNEAFAQAHLRDVDPLATTLSVWMARTNPQAPVLGVVGDVNEGSVRDGAKPTIYYSHRQLSENVMIVFLRSSQAAALAPPALAAIRRIDPNLVVTKVRTFDTAIDESLARERLSALVSGGFALSGLLLAALGLYGLLSYLVAERTREIGTRLALGARLDQVMKPILGRGLGLVSLGAVAGIAGSVALFRLLAALLFGVTAYDLPTYASVFTLLVLVGALASYIPARRAARVQPLVALRHQ